MCIRDSCPLPSPTRSANNGLCERRAKAQQLATVVLGCVIIDAAVATADRAVVSRTDVAWPRRRVMPDVIYTVMQKTGTSFLLCASFLILDRNW